jgi:hypothetical protein
MNLIKVSLLGIFLGYVGISGAKATEENTTKPVAKAAKEPEEIKIVVINCSYTPIYGTYAELKICL